MHGIMVLEEVAIYVIAIVGVLLLFGKEKPMNCETEPATIEVVEVVVESVVPHLASTPIRLLPPMVEVEAIAVVDGVLDPAGSGVTKAEFVPLSEAAFHYAISRFYCPNQVAYDPLGIEFWTSSVRLAAFGCLASAAKVMNQGYNLTVLEADAVVKPEPNWEEMSTDQLRKACTRYGIRWRNARGKQHLKKAEMIEMLSEAYSK